MDISKIQSQTPKADTTPALPKNNDEVKNESQSCFDVPDNNGSANDTCVQIKSENLQYSNGDEEAMIKELNSSPDELEAIAVALEQQLENCKADSEIVKQKINAISEQAEPTISDQKRVQDYMDAFVMDDGTSFDELSSYQKMLLMEVQQGKLCKLAIETDDPVEREYYSKIIDSFSSEHKRLSLEEGSKNSPLLTALLRKQQIDSKLYSDQDDSQ